MRLLVKEVRYNIERAGQGEPLLLLHGFTGSIENWRRQISFFEKYFAVVVIDFMGHGNSDAPGDPLRYRMEWCTADLREIFDELEIGRAHVLGYSMGGRVALHFANAYPERVGNLVLESASPGIPDDKERAQRSANDAALAEKIERDGIEKFVEEWANSPLFATQSRLSEQTRAQLKQQRLQNNARGLANSLRSLSVGVQASLWKVLPTLNVRTLLIAGENDEKFREIASQMARAMPNAKLQIVRNAGHAVHLEEPEIFDELVLSFLAG